MFASPPPHKKILHSRIVLWICILFLLLAFGVNYTYAQNTTNKFHDPHFWDSPFLFYYLRWAPGIVAENIKTSLRAGDASKKEMFFHLVSVIHKNDWVPGSDNKEYARLLSSAFPEDTRSLVDGLAPGISPGRSYTNLLIARSLLDKQLSCKDKGLICQSLTSICSHWGAHTLPAGPERYQPEMARDAIVVIASMGDLPADCHIALLKTLRDNRQMHGGEWIARLLCTQMDKEVAVSHISTILDILENPPEDDISQYDIIESVRNRIPLVFGPQEWLTVSDILPADGGTKDPDEIFFIEWCNKACDPTWPETISDAMSALIVRTGEAGLSAVYERIADDSKSTETRLQLLVCAAQITPDSPRVSRMLLDLLRKAQKNPDWMLAAKVVRNLEMNEDESSRLQTVWRSWYDRRKHEYIIEGDYRFLFAIGVLEDGIQLLERELPSIQKLDASPPFFMFFLEDVPYAPQKYKSVLVELLKADTWWYRCAAMIMLHRYTNYFDTQPRLLEEIAKNDRHRFVRVVCRKIQFIRYHNNAIRELNVPYKKDANKGSR